jgi:hypothetical protein
MAQLNCIVVTPEETALDEQADFVALPLYDGEIGISPGHSPLIGRLGFGEMRIRTGGTVQQFYVDGGFVQVNGNVISVLTNRAVPWRHRRRPNSWTPPTSGRQTHPNWQTSATAPCCRRAHSFALPSEIRSDFIPNVWPPRGFS